MREFGTRVLGGLPVIVRYTRQDGDRSVGEPRYLVEDLEVLDTQGRDAPWIAQQMKPKDWDAVKEAAYEDCCQD